MTDEIAVGDVVYLNSDRAGDYPMTAGGSDDRGRILCRWHDEVRCIQIHWFHPEELYMPDRDDDGNEIVFTPESE